jgi:hypothetical protein
MHESYDCISKHPGWIEDRKVGLIAAKAAALNVNIKTDSCQVVASLTHCIPSHLLLRPPSRPSILSAPSLVLSVLSAPSLVHSVAPLVALP